ncbi:MAG: hypothetical protein GX883_08620 [Firmicutes bacterium]|nr:hypothetical protein [Bacillota bacterium]
MHRFFVIEARRLLPLLFLLVLLVSLSVYDNFFREIPAVAPDEESKNAITFVTADRGDLSAPTSFEVIATMESWTRLRQENSALPDYPFNPAFEYAVSATNSEIESVQVYPQEDGTVQVQVRVLAQPHSYHLVTVEREKVGEQPRWLFLDEKEQIMDEIFSPGEESGAGSKAALADPPQSGGETAGD